MESMRKLLSQRGGEEGCSLRTTEVWNMDLSLSGDHERLTVEAYRADPG